MFRQRNTLALFAAMLVAAIGKGVYLSVSVIFLLTVVGLSPAQVGAGTSAAAVCGLVFSFPIGVLADRIGQKPPCSHSWPSSRRRWGRSRSRTASGTSS